MDQTDLFFQVVNEIYVPRPYNNVCEKGPKFLEPNMGDQGGIFPSDEISTRSISELIQKSKNSQDQLMEADLITITGNYGTENEFKNTGRQILRAVPRALFLIRNKEDLIQSYHSFQEHYIGSNEIDPERDLQVLQLMSCKSANETKNMMASINANFSEEVASSIMAYRSKIQAQIGKITFGSLKSIEKLNGFPVVPFAIQELTKSISYNDFIEKLREGEYKYMSKDGDYQLKDYLSAFWIFNHVLDVDIADWLPNSLENI